MSHPDLFALKNYKLKLSMERMNKPPDTERIKRLEHTVLKLTEKIERRRDRQLHGLPIEDEYRESSDEVTN